MNKNYKPTQRRLKRQAGAAIPEYVLFLAAVLLVITTSVRLVGQRANQTFNRVNVEILVSLNGGGTASNTSGGFEEGSGGNDDDSNQGGGK